MERIPRGIGSRCGVKTIWLAVDADLLQQFAGVAMRKDAVGGKIVGRVHEVRFGRWSLARAADAALGVGNNAVLEIDEARCDKRLQRQNDRGRVAAGIGDQLCAGDLLAMQLGHAVNGLRLRGRGEFGAFVVKGIDGAVGCIGQPPRAAQIDHAQCRDSALRAPTRATARAAWRETALRRRAR